MLKKAYPETKFSVRSKNYTGGSHIRISWTDGPTNDQIKAKVEYFEGADVDAMQDLKTYRGKREWQGEQVSFGADFIFTERSYSEAMLRPAAEREAAKFGMATPEISICESGAAYMNSRTQISDKGYYTIEEHIRKVLEGRDY